MEKTLKFEIGKEYLINEYPKTETYNAHYIGENQGKQVFENRENYFFVDNIWITEKEGVITHKGISSFSIQKFPKAALNLVNILKKLEKI